jgi:serine/threonine protein kinase
MIDHSDLFDESKCKNEYKEYEIKNKKIAAGGGGSIYDTCYRNIQNDDNNINKCTLVTKVIQNSHRSQESIFLKLFRIEASLSNLAGVKGFGPKVIDYYQCEESPLRGNIVMEKWPFSVFQSPSLDSTFFIRKLLPKIKSMHDNGILHTDLFDKNIMYNKQLNISIIDFGLSIPILKPLSKLLRAYDCVTLIFGRYYENQWYNVLKLRNFEKDFDVIINSIIEYVGESNLKKAFQHRIMYMKNPSIDQMKNWILYVDNIVTLQTQFYLNVLKEMNEDVLQFLGIEGLYSLFAWLTTSTSLKTDKNGKDCLKEFWTHVHQVYFNSNRIQKS